MGSRARVIVITGGTGSGKSTVAGVFKKLGARVIDVDRLARQLLKPGSSTWHHILEEFCGTRYIKKTFGKDPLRYDDFLDKHEQPLPELPWVIHPDGTIRRDKLGATVFSELKALKDLNRIMHPPLRKLLNEKIQRHRRFSSRPLVLDMAVYPERIFKGIGDVVLWVRAPGGMRAQRLADSRRLTLEEASARIRMQRKDDEYEKRADFVLANLGSDIDLKQGAERIWTKLLNPVD